MNKLKLAFRIVTIFSIFTVLGISILSDLFSVEREDLLIINYRSAVLMIVLLVNLIPLLSFVHHFFISNKSEKYKKVYFITFLIINSLPVFSLLLSLVLV